MRILLTNDDGIHAPGLKVLEEIARQFSDDIWICAPSEEQSGAGHSLTLTRPVRLQTLGERRFAVTGTPTDSVMMALRTVMPGPPDLILSGVNRGANLGDDVTYSGTVSAAIEGALAGIRSIALSQVYAKEGMGDDVPFAAAEAWGAKAIAPLLGVLVLVAAACAHSNASGGTRPQQVTRSRAISGKAASGPVNSLRRSTVSLLTVSLMAAWSGMRINFN